MKASAGREQKRSQENIEPNTELTPNVEERPRESLDVSPSAAKPRKKEKIECGARRRGSQLIMAAPRDSSTLR